MKGFITTIQRPSKEEVEAAVREKVAEGWEIITPILPKVKKDGAWEPTEQKKLGDHAGYRWDVKYFCKMRKVEESVNKTETKKRVGYLKQRQDELINDLLVDKEQLEDDIKRLEGELKKAINQNARIAAVREKNLAALERLSRQNEKLSRANGKLSEDIIELKRKLENASSAVTSGTRRASVQGFYPAVIKNGKRLMILGAYNTPEKAEEHEKRAYKEL